MTSERSMTPEEYDRTSRARDQIWTAKAFVVFMVIVLLFAVLRAIAFRSAEATVEPEAEAEHCRQHCFEAGAWSVSFNPYNPRGTCECHADFYEEADRD